MQKIVKKYGKYLAIIVVLSLIIPLLAITQSDIHIPEAKPAIELTEEDNQIASDISNMTGVEIEKILELREKGKTWNEILEELKRKKTSNNEKKKQMRSNFLTHKGIAKDTIERLREEGFSDENIMKAKLLVERIIFQLQDITSNISGTVEITKPEADKPNTNTDNEDKEDLSSYTELLNKLDINTALYLILKLEQDFGSIEKVLDEYLYTLQVDIDFKLYIVDKEKYIKQKEEKSLGIQQQKIITIAKIEEKMLEKIQYRNTKENIDIKNKEEIITDSNNNEIQKPVPDIPNPTIEDVKPKKPGADVMEEIKIINPMEEEGE